MLLRLRDTKKIASVLILSLVSGSACTGQIPGSFRYTQQEEVFKSTSTVGINTKLDMLWVVDNSPSMSGAQKKLRDGFRVFAERYMKPNWDIRVAVITQDTFLAHPSFSTYLNSVYNGGWYSREEGYSSAYLNPASSATIKRSTPFVTPAWWAPTSINSLGTVVGSGVKIRHGIPDYGGLDLSQDVSATNPSAWARLIPGRHDGPMSTICWSSAAVYQNPFFYGVTRCHVRDQQDVYLGVSGCVNGGIGDDDSTIQCVNTVMNNTVRSGKPIISTQPPAGVPADAAWNEQLIKDFLVNMSSGVSGLGREKFFNSIQQLIVDNEAPTSTTKFFRPDALRAIIIVSDEDDQSMIHPNEAIFPDWGYNSGASCTSKTVDTHTYTLQPCVQTDKLLPVASFKNQLDQFFRALDGDLSGTGNPNYFVASISPLTGGSIKALQDSFGEGYSSASTDYASRVFELENLVGNGSLRLELNTSDYTPLLDAIGRVIVQKKAVFELRRIPSGEEEMIVKIRHADGTETVIPSSKYVVVGRTLEITDYDLVLSFTATDEIIINYQPKNLQ